MLHIVTSMMPAAKMLLPIIGALALSACHHGHYYDRYGYDRHGYDRHSHDRPGYDGEYDGRATYNDNRGYDGGYYGGDDRRGHHKKKKHRGYRDRDSYGYDGYRGYRRRGHHGGGYACDPDGDRCYRSHSPYWDYREYYRRHGYRWRD